jgi:hypothetical protein
LILTRIGNALRKQDWVSFLAEITIVVVAIVIGLQVDDWNTSRLDRIEAAYYLDRVAQEASDTARLIGTEIQTAGELIDDVAKAIDMIRNGTVDDNNRTEFDASFAAALYFPDFRFVAGALNELRATGRLEAIRDAELRKSLTQYHESGIFKDKQYRFLVDQFGRAIADLQKLVDLHIDFLTNSTLVGVNESFNGNTELARALTAIHLLQQVQRNYLQDFFDETQEFANTITESGEG